MPLRRGLSQGYALENPPCRTCPLTRRSWSPSRLANWWRPPAYMACCRDGCHHCGQRGSAVIADHIPPNKLVFGSTRTQFEKGLNERAKVFTRDLGRGSHSITRLLRATNKALNIELGEEAAAGLCGSARQPLQQTELLQGYTLDDTSQILHCPCLLFQSFYHSRASARSRAPEILPTVSPLLWKASNRCQGWQAHASDALWRAQAMVLCRFVILV